jgi:hypothetical protein
MDHIDPARIDPGGEMTSHVYEVIVRGRMSAELIASLDGFTIDTGEGGLTRLIGEVPDQPQLLGLLAAFDDLHIEVVSVNPVSADNA